MAMRLVRRSHLLRYQFEGSAKSEDRRDDWPGTWSKNLLIDLIADVGLAFECNMPASSRLWDAMA